MLPNIPATIRWGTPWLVADQTYLDKLRVVAPRKLDHLQRQMENKHSPHRLYPWPQAGLNPESSGFGSTGVDILD